MKTIKVVVKVSGYLNKVDHKDFDLVESEMSIDANDSIEQTAVQFLNDSFKSIAQEALEKWNNLKYDYKGVQNES